MAVHAQPAPSGHDADPATVAPAGLTGLDEAEAQHRLARHGPNAVAGSRSRGLIDIVRAGIDHFHPEFARIRRGQFRRQLRSDALHLTFVGPDHRMDV